MSARSQRPGATPRARRRPIRKTKGRTSPAGGPARVSIRAEAQAPPLPIQLPGGPPAAVMSEGSLQ